MAATRAAVVERLAAAGCVVPDAEADEILAAAPDGDTVEAWVARREQGEPLAWIVGTTRFCRRTLFVDRGVYVPRHQTEELARRAAALLPRGGAALDVCTGSGAVAAHLADAVPTATVVGVDIDPMAAACARRNGVTAVIGDGGRPFRPQRFDVVTVVAPYVPTVQLALLPSDVLRHEPRAALDGGDDGLDLVRRIAEDAAELLRPGGWLLLEVGGDQDIALLPTLTRLGYAVTTTWRDDDGDLRGVAARAP